MKRARSLCVLIAVAVLACGAAGTAEAQEAPAVRPIQVALFAPVQIFPESTEIVGARLNLLYGRNVAVTGLDIGLVNHTTGGASTAFQYGVVGISEGDFTGWQNNFVNLTKGEFEGLQYGAVNASTTAKGLLVGVVNHADRAEGLMLGIVNHTEMMEGLQVGLVNIISQKSDLPVLPIVNWSF